MLYTLGHNQWSHLTFEEWRRSMLSTMASRPSGDGLPRSVFNRSVDVSMDVDWQEKGAVTEVKTQGNCESCYSFATTGAVEGISFIEHGRLLDLSEQMIVSCDALDNGCATGLMDNAFAWINSVGGLCSESDYPYVSGDGSVPACDNTRCSVQSNTLVTSAVDVPPIEPMLATALMQQPIAVGIDAACEELMRYSAGIYETDCGVDVNHAVLAVGFGLDLLTEFWKVKNSWGTTWGEGGYVRMRRGLRADQTGICSIATRASYPTLA